MNDPLNVLYCITTGDGTGHHTVDLVHHDHVTLWTHSADRARFLRLAAPAPEISDKTLSAVPLVERGNRRLHGVSSVVWVRTHNRETVRRLAEFKPRPTIVLQVGSTVDRTALWALHRPVEPDDCEKVNKHLAHALGAKKLHASCSFSYHPPGTTLTEGRKRPVVVECVGGSEDAYGVGRVCKSLPTSIPDPRAAFKAHLERQAA